MSSAELTQSNAGPYRKHERPFVPQSLWQRRAHLKRRERFFMRGRSGCCTYSVSSSSGTAAAAAAAFSRLSMSTEATSAADAATSACRAGCRLAACRSNDAVAGPGRPHPHCAGTGRAGAGRARQRGGCIAVAIAAQSQTPPAVLRCAGLCLGGYRLAARLAAKPSSTGLCACPRSRQVSCHTYIEEASRLHTIGFSA